MARAREDLLGIYLNDHMAGATAGLALARRIAGHHRAGPAAAETADLARQVDSDRLALGKIMDTLGVRVKAVRRVLAVAGERLGRLKLNGAVLSRSPLSDVLEFESMQIGVAGKLAGWKALRRLADSDDRLVASQLDHLIALAEDQSETLEQLRLQAVERALRPR